MNCRNLFLIHHYDSVTASWRDGAIKTNAGGGDSYMFVSVSQIRICVVCSAVLLVSDMSSGNV